MIEVRQASELDVMLAFQNKKPIYLGETDMFTNAIACLRAGYPTRSLWVGKEVIGVVGFMPYWEGVGVVSAIFTPEVEKYPVAFFKIMKSMLADLSKTVHRVEITVKLDYTQGIRFAEALGFEREGILRKYTADGSDCVMFGRVK